MCRWEMVSRLQDELSMSKANWIPACNGTEEPFYTRNRRRLLYVWNTYTGEHAYLDCETDLILSPEESLMMLGM